MPPRDAVVQRPERVDAHAVAWASAVPASARRSGPELDPGGGHLVEGDADLGGEERVRADDADADDAGNHCVLNGRSPSTCSRDPTERGKEPRLKTHYEFRHH